ncbi:copper amine oxidase N-terminal domain-containing protein [Paenibacillus terrigena]|uniref:copper amine oxidase N-terminal domain-containing protein n=1 Tax=Paenibacillus terrigena TaxID=369333 RepID=UPI0028D201E0|nr:copper amine oxidase N-terminal domain-containing protein [Paenibacillus terrigena]
MGKKLSGWLICLALVFTMVMPGVAMASEGNSVELKFKLGSTNATLNGQRISIAKPYTEKGATMVPLSLITKAFQVEFSFENNKKITITSGEHTIQFVIGSTNATVDGRTVQTGAAPKLVGGVVMVPMRVVTDALGANVKVEADRTIVITANLDGNAGTGAIGGIDSDAGKTMIGDSYYMWSMRYPTGLVKQFQSEADDYVSFTDEKGTYLLAVSVTKVDDPLTDDDLLKQLTNAALSENGLVVDKKTVKSGATPYAQVISKGEDGVYSAIRGYYANDTYYELYYSDGLAKNYKDLAKHNDLLNSFRPAYDKGNAKLKDLSTVVGGMRKAVNSDYGVTVTVPASWSLYPEDLIFGNEDGSAQLTFDISSAASGLKVDAWAGQMDQYFKDVFVPDAWKLLTTEPIKVDGQEGVLKKYQYTTGEDTYVQSEIFLISGSYKYLIQYDYDSKNTSADSLFGALVKGIKLNTKELSSNFGFLEDTRAYVDRSLTSVKSSKKNGYSLTIPNYWMRIEGEYGADPGKMQYQFPGGSFEVSVNSTDRTLSEEVEAYKYVYEQQRILYKNYTVTSTESTTLAGQPTYKIVLDGKDAHHEQYVIVKDGKVYSLLSTIMMANRTDVNEKAIQSVFQSLKWVN